MVIVHTSRLWAEVCVRIVRVSGVKEVEQLVGGMQFPEALRLSSLRKDPSPKWLSVLLPGAAPFPPWWFTSGWDGDEAGEETADGWDGGFVAVTLIEHYPFGWRWAPPSPSQLWSGAVSFSCSGGQLKLRPSLLVSSRGGSFCFMLVLFGLQISCNHGRHLLDKELISVFNISSQGRWAFLLLVLCGQGCLAPLGIQGQRCLGVPVHGRIPGTGWLRGVPPPAAILVYFWINNCVGGARKSQMFSLQWSAIICSTA